MVRKKPNLFEIIFNFVILVAFAFDLFLLIGSLIEFAKLRNAENENTFAPGIGGVLLLVYFLIGFFIVLGVSLIKWIIYMRRSSRYRGARKTWLIQLPFFAVGVIACLIIASTGLIPASDFSPALLALFAVAGGALVTFVFSDVDFWRLPFSQASRGSTESEDQLPQSRE